MARPSEAALERAFQREVKEDLVSMFPGVDIFKAELHQGAPDLLLLIDDRWAMLECKRETPGPDDYEPNQEWYIEYYNSKSFAAMICPENKEEVLDALQRSFSASR